jgi:hypothetical protein
MMPGLLSFLGIDEDKLEGNGIVDGKTRLREGDVTPAELVSSGAATPEAATLLNGLFGQVMKMEAPTDPGKTFNDYLGDQGGFKGFMGDVVGEPILNSLFFGKDEDAYEEARTKYAMDSKKYDTLLGAYGKDLERQLAIADPRRERLAVQYDANHPQIAEFIRAGGDFSEIDNNVSAATQVVAEGSSVYNPVTKREDYRNKPENVSPGGVDSEGLREIWSEEGRWFDDASRFVNPYNDGLATLTRTLDAGKVYYEDKPEKVSETEWNQRKATADQALVFGVMKALDENSVVRESEYATAEAQRPITEAFPMFWEKLQNGETLTPEQRKSIIAFTKNVGDELAGRRDKEVGRITRVLDRRRGETRDAYGLSEDDASKYFTNVLPALVDYGPNQQLSSWLGEPMQQLSEVNVPERRKRSKVPAPIGVDPVLWDYMDEKERALWLQQD